MKNITLSVEDKLYGKTRVIVAHRKTTVTGLVRGSCRPARFKQFLNKLVAERGCVRSNTRSGWPFGHKHAPTA